MTPPRTPSAHRPLGALVTIALAVALATVLAVALAVAAPPPVARAADGVIISADSCYHSTNTPSDPYLISDAVQLDCIRQNLAAHYRLANDIDLTGYTTGADGTDWRTNGWEPIGWNTYSGCERFTGSLDGDGHVITGLWSNGTGQRANGLFGCVGHGATIKNLGVILAPAGITSTFTKVGALVGDNYGQITNSYAAGTIAVSVSLVNVDVSIGGLVGHNGYVTYNYAYNNPGTYVPQISNSHSSVAVRLNNQGWVYGSLISGVGGLVGVNEGIVRNSDATGAVTCDGGCIAGGLVGTNHWQSDILSRTLITDSHATGTVTSSGTAGGLLGFNHESTVDHSNASGAVSGGGSTGGFVGVNGWDSAISRSYATGPVTGGQYVGGFVGDNDSGGKITSSYATGEVTGDRRVGGFVGDNESRADISDAYATGAVTGNSSVGGFVGGFSETPITNSYATGKVTGQGDGIAGFAGNSNNAYFTPPVSPFAGSFFDRRTTGQDIAFTYQLSDGTTRPGPSDGSAGVTGVSDRRTNSESTFTHAGWDFTSTWTMPTGYYWPYLQWQTPPPPPDPGDTVGPIDFSQLIAQFMAQIREFLSRLLALLFSPDPLKIGLASGAQRV